MCRSQISSKENLAGSRWQARVVLRTGPLHPLGSHEVLAKMPDAKLTNLKREFVRRSKIVEILWQFVGTVLAHD